MYFNGQRCLFENSTNRESDLIWTLHSRISGEAAVDRELRALLPEFLFQEIVIGIIALV